MIKFTVTMTADVKISIATVLTIIALLVRLLS